MVVSIAFGTIIGIAHYFNELFSLKSEKYRNKIISFSAGISITYIFLHLLPEFIAAQINRFIFLSILLGFVIFHLVEKYIYQHSSEDKLLKELAIEDSITSFIYHLHGFYFGLRERRQQ